MALGSSFVHHRACDQLGRLHERCSGADAVLARFELPDFHECLGSDRVHGLTYRTVWWVRTDRVHPGTGKLHVDVACVVSRPAAAAGSCLAAAVLGCGAASPLVDLPDHVSAQIDAAPPSQLEVIADGEVSFGDVEQAAQAVAQCLRDEGLKQVSVDYEAPARPGLVGQFGWTMAVVDVEAAIEAEARGEYFEDASDLALDRCYDEHYSAVGALYDYLNTDPRVAEQFMQEMLEQSGG